MSARPAYSRVRPYLERKKERGGEEGLREGQSASQDMSSQAASREPHNVRDSLSLAKYIQAKFFLKSENGIFG